VTAKMTLLYHGRTLIPGLVGLHDHLFYQLESAGVTSVVPAQRTFATLYHGSDESDIDPRVPVLVSSRLRSAFQRARDERKDRQKAGQSSGWTAVLRHEMEFERAFVSAGGTLLAGADPTGWGAIVAGYGDQRGLELLVRAGFSPEAAIAIATSNGARFLKDPTVGRIAEGLRADLVVLQGNPHGLSIQRAQPHRLRDAGRRRPGTHCVHIPAGPGQQRAQRRDDVVPRSIRADHSNGAGTVGA
jgi:hypothetical protein